MSEKLYTIRDYADRLTPGEELKIERSLSMFGTPAELSHLITLSPEAVQAMRDGSAIAEQKVFDNLKEAAKAWEMYAVQTHTLDMALEYLKTPEISHSENKWEKNQYDNNTISNKVYQMNYYVYEETKYNRDTKTSEPVALHLTWGVYTNYPAIQRYGSNRCGAKIAGQERKRFTNKADMEKYLVGRIKAYSHLFKEDSPPIPKEHVNLFQVNGQLLPGYRVEGEAERKPSLAETLKANAQKSKEQFGDAGPSVAKNIGEPSL